MLKPVKIVLLPALIDRLEIGDITRNIATKELNIISEEKDADILNDFSKFSDKLEIVKPWLVSNTEKLIPGHLVKGAGEWLARVEKIDGIYLYHRTTLNAKGNNVEGNNYPYNYSKVIATPAEIRWIKTTSKHMQLVLGKDFFVETISSYHIKEIVTSLHDDCFLEAGVCEDCHKLQGQQESPDCCQRFAPTTLEGGVIIRI